MKIEIHCHCCGEIVKLGGIVMKENAVMQQRGIENGDKISICHQCAELDEVEPVGIFYKCVNYEIKP